MGMTNKEIISKAQITTDAIAAAGKLNPQQADRFIDYVYDLTGLKNKVRTVRFRPDQMDIDKINVGQRAAVAKAEATDPQVRRGVSTSKVTLTPFEIMVPFEISDDFMEYNIEGMDVEDHIIRMMATQMGNDIEELYIDGEKLGPARYQGDLFDGGSLAHVVKDSYMALGDGWLKKMRGGNVVDAAGANINSTLFSKMINALPEKYKRNKANLRFFCSTNIEQNYRQVIGSRATSSGDTALSSTSLLTPFGIPLEPFSLWASTPRATEHVVLNGTTAVSLLFKNIVAASEVVTLAGLNGTPTSPFGTSADYAIDYVNGTIARKSGGAITDGATVKITYQSEAQIALTEYRNLIAGIGREIRIERDRDIFRGVNQYAITAKVCMEIENLEAVVWAKNVGLK
jgi:hypothetical protein